MRTLLLQVGKNHNTVLTNGRATPDEIAIAMLGLNKVIQTLVAEFQLKLDLTNVANADWRTAILETSKRRLKVQRTEEKRRKRKELKEQKEKTRSRLEWLQQNQPEVHKCEEDEKNDTDTPAGKCLVERLQSKETDEELTLKTKNKTKPAIKVKAKSKKRTSEQIGLDVRHKKTKTDDNKQQPTDEEKKPTRMDAAAQPKLKETRERHKKSKADDNKQQPTDEEKKPTRMDAAVHPKLKETTEMENKSIPNDNRNKSMEMEKQRPTHVVDPFFITESGQPYMSTAVVLSGDSNNESEDEMERQNYVEQRKQKSLAKKQDYNNTRFNERLPARVANEDETEPRNYMEQRKQKPLANKLDYKNPRFNARHPAWVADEQQKPIVTNFKGKKIKFGEDGDITETSIAPPVPTAPNPTPVSTEGMHPSWVAKQKLKPKIAVFSGKKIKFDD
ncbi:hypothetical protein AWZ03_001335 [Drosophila navojoa]|uniref:Serum response factor-binding protein 1 n=2 Tax=Drosophila navojoa TaxID=7232 RepID=A0A484BTR8_DRONA|nr:hypothetical protein AWZ03_001335 [Drosophila navojoa]